MLWGDWRVCTFETLCLPLDKRRIFRKPTRPSLPLRKAPPFISVFFNGLYTPFGSPICGGQKSSGTRGCNRPTVLYLPHLSLSCGRGLNPLPSPRPFQKDKGCNRTFSVLGTATLYGWRGIKALARYCAGWDRLGKGGDNMGWACYNGRIDY